MKRQSDSEKEKTKRKKKDKKRKEKTDSGVWKIEAGAFEDWTREGEGAVSHPWHFSCGFLLDGSGSWA